MISEIFSKLTYFMNLTTSKEVLWIVLPLLIATISMVIYFQRYKDEWPGWNTLVANSLVLFFVGMILIRYIYEIDGVGAVNFITFYGKFILSIVVILLGIIMASLNFKHYLPKKLAVWISSPLTLNLTAYILLLIVYSNIKYDFNSIIALLIWFLFLISIFHLIKNVFKRIFLHLKGLKEREPIEDIKLEKKPTEDKKRKLKIVENNIKKEKKKIKKQENKIREGQKNKLKKQIKKAIKLKKEIKK